MIVNLELRPQKLRLVPDGAIHTGMATQHNIFEAAENIIAPHTAALPKKLTKHFLTAAVPDTKTTMPAPPPIPL